MQRVRLSPIALFFLIGCYASVVWGSIVTVNPVRLHISATQRSETLLLRNGGTTPARFQISMHVWAETPSGETRLAPTTDLLFFPSLLEIKPGETRRIRVASTLGPGKTERSYRLIAAELPQAGGRGGVVQVLTKFSIPVFVGVAKAVAKPSVSIHVERGQLVVSLRNDGEGHFRTKSLRVVARSASGAVVYEQVLVGWYVLARGRRDYRIQLPPGKCGPIASVSATLTTETGKASGAGHVRPGADCAA
jgi:P pilus assembly chaperone PapD